MTATKSEWYFIVNPRAGSGKTMSEWVPAERKLEKLGIPYVTAYTDYKNHATELARLAAAEGFRKIAAVGGDGSLHEVLGGICRWCDESGTDTSEFRLAVVPIGSGNDWIKSMKVPHDVDDVVGLIALDSFVPMDVVRVDMADGGFSYLANCGGVGFDSHVCKTVNLQKERGMRGKRIYINALIRTIRTLKAINIQVIADGTEVFSGPCFSVAMGNGRYSGSGMRQVPLADTNDDFLDVMIVPKVPVTTILKEVPRLFSGTINESENVISLRCRTLSIVPLDADSADIVEVDGEIEGRLPISISMVNRKIGALKG